VPALQRMDQHQQGRALTFDEVSAALQQSAWIFAKTMPDAPHWYTLRKHWAQPVPFESVVGFIREHGYREQFGKSWYTRLDINGLKYWSMGAPLPATILINRAKIDRPQPYDLIASSYDSLWATAEADAENREIINRIDYEGGSVLDIGCGTGLWPDYQPMFPDDYLGIDPSHEMLRRFHAKHPGLPALPTTFEAFSTGERFDTVISLFGAASYVDPAAWMKLPGLLKPNGRYVLMFYRPGYEPETHRRTGVVVPFNVNLPDLPGTVTPFHHFNILEGP
jgi:hypothetical protein